MIELFKQPNIDWMGKAKFFFALSLLLLIAGWTSVFLKGGPAHGGLPYSIDFKGGTNVDVRFAQAPNVDQLRRALTAQGLGDSEIQAISDNAIPGAKANEVVISLEQKGQGDQALDTSKAQVLTALNAIYGQSNSDHPDFNAATPNSLAAFLTQRDPLLLSTNAGDRYQQLAKKILQYRDTDSNGVVTNLDDLAKVDGATPAVLSALKAGYALGPFTIRNVEIVGPKPFTLPSMLWRACWYILHSASSGFMVPRPC